jgi:hypothetical protein
MASKSSKGFQVKIDLPKRIASGAKARTNPYDSTAIGSQIREAWFAPYLDLSVQQLRRVWNTTRLLRFLARSEGPISTAIFNLVQVADCGYTIMAYDANTNHYDPAGSELAASILARMDTINDSNGFDNTMGFTSLLQMMLREVVLTNGVASELVLNKGHMPDHIQIIGLETLKWIKGADNSYTPIQYQNGEAKPVSLDIATFFVERAVGDPTDLEPRSIMEAAIKMLVFFEEVLEDIRRTLKQTGYARNVISIDLEKVKAAAPRDVLADSKKFAGFCEEVRTTIETAIKNIDPEDSLVMFNTATYEIVSADYGKNIDYTPMMNQISGMYATSMKTPPTVLGMRMDSGSQALGNVETLIFLKAARAIQLPVNVTMSRILTMAARLAGANVYVRFAYDPVNIRPEIETEAFQQMRQSRILEQLSLGFIDDDKAAALLKTGRRPPGAPKLSGTFFTVKANDPGLAAGEPPADNAGTPDGNAKQPKPGDSAMGKTLQPDKKAPRKAGGKSQ